MIQGATVIQLTARILHNGFLRDDLAPMVLEHGIGGPFTFQYVRLGETVGEVHTPYPDFRAGRLLDEMAESIRLLACPSLPQLYENLKMEDWLVARLGAYRR